MTWLADSPLKARKASNMVPCAPTLDVTYESLGNAKALCVLRQWFVRKPNRENDIFRQLCVRVLASHARPGSAASLFVDGVFAVRPPAQMVRAHARAIVAWAMKSVVAWWRRPSFAMQDEGNVADFALFPAHPHCSISVGIEVSRPIPTSRVRVWGGVPPKASNFIFGQIHRTLHVGPCKYNGVPNFG